MRKDIWNRRPEILKITAEYFGVDKQDLMSKSRRAGLVEAKHMLIYWLAIELGNKGDDVVKFMTPVIKDRSHITHIIKKINTQSGLLEEYENYKNEMNMRAIGNQAENITFEKEEKVSYMSCFIDGQDQYREEKVYCFVGNDNGSMVVELRTRDGFKPTVQRTMIKKGW